MIVVFYNIFVIYFTFYICYKQDFFLKNAKESSALLKSSFIMTFNMVFLHQGFLCGLGEKLFCLRPYHFMLVLT